MSALVTPRQAAERLCALTAILRRTDIERTFQPEDDEKIDEEACQQALEDENDLRGWLDARKLWGLLSPREVELLQTPMGLWSRQQILNGLWRLESAGILLWTLGDLPACPPFDENFPPEDIHPMLPWFRDVETFFSVAILREEDEIRATRDLAELWHWRARTSQVARSPKKYGVTVGQLQEIVRRSADAGERDHLFTPIDHDFPAFQKPYRELNEDQLWMATSIALERHYILNWLCGYAEEWDDVPTDT
ncbi:MAG: DUF4272 domain-containing protein [Acidobacteriales bacterium]|nr:DUF4272 domain-containing protein [Terriglobales bacterium]